MQFFGGKPNGKGCKRTRPMWHTHYNIGVRHEMRSVCHAGFLPR